jgi:hypothetical protein
MWGSIVLCAVWKTWFGFCLSASVNVRYILHTQPLRFIYNKILVWVSLYPPFVGLSFSPSTPFATVACYHFTSPSSSLYLINPYSFNGKRWNLQCQWPWRQQCHKSTISWVVVGHAYPAFRDLGATTTCQLKDAMNRRKTLARKGEAWC